MVCHPQTWLLVVGCRAYHLTVLLPQLVGCFKHCLNIFPNNRDGSQNRDPPKNGWFITINTLLLDDNRGGTMT